MSDFKMPPEAEIKSDYQKKKAEFEKAFKTFHKDVYLNKKLDANKTMSVKNVEHQAVDALIKSAVALDNVNVGEGLLALSTIAIRELLTMRDRVNELEYEILKTLKEVKELKKKQEPQKEPPKKDAEDVKKS